MSGISISTVKQTPKIPLSLNAEMKQQYDLMTSDGTDRGAIEAILRAEQRISKVGPYTTSDEKIATLAHYAHDANRCYDCIIEVKFWNGGVSTSDGHGGTVDTEYGKWVTRKAVLTCEGDFRYSASEVEMLSKFHNVTCEKKDQAPTSMEVVHYEVENVPINDKMSYGKVSLLFSSPAAYVGKVWATFDVKDSHPNNIKAVVLRCVRLHGTAIIGSSIDVTPGSEPSAYVWQNLYVLFANGGVHISKLLVDSQNSTDNTGSADPNGKRPAKPHYRGRNRAARK